MFDVRFYIFSKKNNSTKTPDGSGTSFDCNIRNVSNILNPSIELKHSNPTNFNYCFINAFHRYYFISNWTWNNGLWIASCTVDVLGTYKTNIGSQTKHVVRSASRKNSDLIDNMFPMLAESTSEEQSFYPYSSTSMTMDNGYIVIGVVGSNTTGQTMYQMTPSSFQTLISKLLTTADGYDWGDLSQGVINSLMNPLQFLVSCRWYPKAFVTGSEVPLKFGNWSSGVSAYPVLMSKQSEVPYLSIINAFAIRKHPDSTSKGNYMNLKPFTTSLLDVGAFGLVELDPTLLYGRNYIYLQGFVDPYSGMGTLKGWAENGTHTYDRLLFKKDVMFGINIPLSSNDANAVPSLLQTTLGLMGGVVDFGAIGDVVKSVSGSIETSASSGSAIQHLQKFRFIQTFRKQTDVDGTNVGYPLNANVLISTLSGYVKCLDGNVDLSCTDTEKEKIKQYLENGFYYE